ncbi:hypothetical protein [Kitasatospora sp. MMS16-BH015]|uniref:hypothetical protein n=1 Tax=Kitasatospora sp. MMS16-BH015 TaxID=2018025 RepID=UPI000CF29CD2|nr:hypothetical protein [Kitasatospora sp. MMS16-BH015]
MSRLALTTAGAIGLALIAAAPAVAAPATATTTATTVTTCSYSGLQSGLSTKVCADITGNNVVLWGQIGLAGPPSPGTVLQPQQLWTVLDGSVVNGQSLGTSSKWVNFFASTTRVDGVSGTVACGSTVHASFSVDGPQGWGPRPVYLDVPVNC